MKYIPTFTGSTPNADCAPFPASVPGNIQKDFLDANPDFLTDINFGQEHRKMRALEPYTWIYTTSLDFERKSGEKLWFVTDGIDYIWDLALDGEIFYSHEGMFSRVELCLDDMLGEKQCPAPNSKSSSIPTPCFTMNRGTVHRPHSAASLPFPTNGTGIPV